MSAEVIAHDLFVDRFYNTLVNVPIFSLFTIFIFGICFLFIFPLFSSSSNVCNSHGDEIKIRDIKVFLHPDDIRIIYKSKPFTIKILVFLTYIFNQIWRVISALGILIGFLGGVLQFCVYFGWLPAQW